MHVEGGAEELRAVLAAYKLVKDASWPDLNPTMMERSLRWPSRSEGDLRNELETYVREASDPSCNVRVFWKTGSNLTFAGCNDQFARDAGKKSASELIGLNDFSDTIPWQAQAGKYRFDDKEVVDTGHAKLDILERQTSAAGVVWVLVGKAPIRTANGQVLGVLGMYELIEAARATKLFAERSHQSS